jgi:hypothetical protein
MAYIKQACNLIAQKVADDNAPPRKASDDGDGGWLRPKEVGLYKKDPEQVRREAQHEAAFEAAMGPGRQLHEEGFVAKDAVAAAVLIGELGQRPLFLSGRARGSLTGSARGALPDKGDIIEALWTEDDKDEWLTVEVLLTDVPQLQATGQERAARAVCEVPSNPVHRQLARMGSSRLARSPHQAIGRNGRIHVRKEQGQARSSTGGGPVALPGPVRSFPCRSRWVAVMAVRSRKTAFFLAKHFSWVASRPLGAARL